MTREEEIKKASIEFVESFDILSVGDKVNISQSFRNGAKWADETINKKVCEWLEQNLHRYVSIMYKVTHYENDVLSGEGKVDIDFERLIKDIKKEILDFKK